MLTPSEAKQQSEVINSLRLPATVLVIAAHSVITTKGQALSFELSPDNIFLILEQLCLSFGPLSVALFSLITGYFFFYKLNSFTPKQYTLELKKRFSSLLIPYILWNIIALVLIAAKNYIGLYLGVELAYNDIEWSIISQITLKSIFWTPIDGPLWYIREIMLLSILSPLIYLLVKDKAIGLISIILITSYACFAVLPLGLSSHISCLFICGAYLGLHKMSILKLCTRLSYLSYPLGLLYPYMRIFAEGESWTSPFLLPSLILSVIMLFNIGRVLHTKYHHISRWFAEKSNAVFFMYAAHYILYINLVRGSLYSLLPWDDSTEKIVALLLTCIIVPIATYHSYKLLAYLSPRVTQWLCGGRG